MRAHILYVEDDETLSFVTKDQLELSGYEVTHCPDGASALARFRENEFDLCIIDIMLPEIDGFEVAREIRMRNAEVPILFLTAKSLKEDRIEGLKIGGDDYITKPFSIEELMLRIEVFLRRRKLSDSTKEEIFRIGMYSFDYPNLDLGFSENRYSLTQREADLLKFLATNKNKVVKRSEILLNIWGDDDYFLGRSLDVFISRLRKYLKDDPEVKIENLHGVGFRFRC
jgi:DNA-binding response OmpR family regulator